MNKKPILSFLLLPCIFFLLSDNVLAQNFSLDAFEVTNTQAGGQKYTVNMQILALMTVLTILPALVLMMTSFTRIVIVLAILRQALGMPQTPSNQIVIGISLFLSLFIMSPVFDMVYQDSIKPLMEDKISQADALEKAKAPVRAFMVSQVRQTDLMLFQKLANINNSDSIESSQEFESNSQIPMTILIPAFITSELKTAFQIGFIIFVPFLIIDLVVASVLMSMGMMMLSPLIISLPFKIMLFVLVDGWNLLIGTLANSFVG